ncbi:VOC family protein [Gramella jeungdoensis]|uniref:VOC family protein n=1 Tax=Gramella jeungdoensis TaxID=708091 RepID=A0ABT0YYT6_9FLAO|nr:VOC family protein [Gramella jeungdoensis]MCM8568628.1 VOC family protein [Gramella jeungdoensis]
MKAKLYRVILPVNDIDRAEKFYSDILDQKGIRVSPGRHYFDIGGTILACYDPKSDGDDQGEWKFHENQYIYISVANLENIRDRMKKSDCRFLGEIEEMPWGEILFYANDPFGNPICFVDEKTVFTGN